MSENLRTRQKVWSTAFRGLRYCNKCDSRLVGICGSNSCCCYHFWTQFNPRQGLHTSNTPTTANAHHKARRQTKEEKETNWEFKLAKKGNIFCRPRNGETERARRGLFTLNSEKHMSLMSYLIVEHIQIKEIMMTFNARDYSYLLLNTTGC